jgi:hypothetical protein
LLRRCTSFTSEKVSERSRGIKRACQAGGRRGASSLHCLGPLGRPLRSGDHIRQGVRDGQPQAGAPALPLRPRPQGRGGGDRGADRVAAYPPLERELVRPPRRQGGVTGARLPVCAGRDNAACGAGGRVIRLTRSATHPSQGQALLVRPRSSHSFLLRAARYGGQEPALYSSAGGQRSMAPGSARTRRCARPAAARCSLDVRRPNRLECRSVRGRDRHEQL